MAVGLMVRFDGATEDQYRAVHSLTGVDHNPPEGLIFHSAGPIEGGWRIIDFWESRAAFDRFLESGFGPAAQELGNRSYPTPPDIEEFPVHNIIKP
ncbi:MAG: hypothetical protein ACTHQQ_13940 [Solirubrobacteraceae bacterium]